MVGLIRKIGLGGADKQEEVGGPSDTLITLSDPSCIAAEACRTLRTNLLYSFANDPPGVIIVTSPGTEEGKSTICANLGVVLAQAEKSTLVVDCDLRRPQMHQVFGSHNFRGVVDVLAKQCEPYEAWQEAIPELKVLTSGPVPPNPAELLGSKRFAEFLEQMRQEFSYVLIDVPPVRMVSDPAIIAAQGDGVLLVLDPQKTRKRDVQQSMRSLKTVGARVLGTVTNNVNASSGELYDYANYSNLYVNRTS